MSVVSAPLTSKTPPIRGGVLSCNMAAEVWDDRNPGPLVAFKRRIVLLYYAFKVN